VRITQDSPTKSVSSSSSPSGKSRKGSKQKAEESDEEESQAFDGKEKKRKKAPQEGKKKDQQPSGANQGETNLLVQSLLADFQESLRAKFKTRKQAFDKLGGSDDARIDEYEFQTFLKGHGYTNSNLNKQLFCLIDCDGDGSISRAEFKALFDVENHEMDDFKSMLRETFKSRKDAFDKLGGKDDGKIDLEEFCAFVNQHMGITDARKAKKLFMAIDDNQNESISHAEFKALFQPDGEVAKVVEFKEDLRTKFRNRHAAFEQLGGKDDGKIDKEEFQNFLCKQMGYDNRDLNEQLFNIVDDDNNGYITKGEFEALFLTQTAKAVELRNNLKQKLQEKFKSRKQAFNWLGGGDDDRVDHEEFQEFMRRELGSENVKENEEVFLWMDQDNDGYVTIGEFKQFF